MKTISLSTPANQDWLNQTRRLAEQPDAADDNPTLTDRDGRPVTVAELIAAKRLEDALAGDDE